MTIRRSAAALLLLLAGCSFFSKTKIKTFDLTAVPATAAVASTGTPVGIDVFELPPGFDRRDIVVRNKNQQLDVRGTELWSASLQELALHTLAFDLASRLPEGMVVLPGQTKPPAMRSIDIVFAELVPGPENAITLDARWVVRSGATGAPVTHHERFTTAVASLDSADIASGMSQALATFADRIVAQLSAR